MALAALGPTSLQDNLLGINLMWTSEHTNTIYLSLSLSLQCPSKCFQQYKNLKSFKRIQWVCQLLKGFSPLSISSNFPAILPLLTNQHSLHTHSLSFKYSYCSIIAEVRSELGRLQDPLQLNLLSSNPLLEPPTNIHSIANASYGSAAIMCLQLFSCCDNLMIYDENSL